VTQLIDREKMQQQAIQEKLLQHFYQPKKISKEFLFDTNIFYIYNLKKRPK
jgi:hypothetical protein